MRPAARPDRSETARPIAKSTPHTAQNEPKRPDLKRRVIVDSSKTTTAKNNPDPACPAHPHIELARRSPPDNKCDDQSYSRSLQQFKSKETGRSEDGPCKDVLAFNQAARPAGPPLEWFAAGASSLGEWQEGGDILASRTRIATRMYSASSRYQRATASTVESPTSSTSRLGSSCSANCQLTARQSWVGL
jgi:hypothetical protein